MTTDTGRTEDARPSPPWGATAAAVAIVAAAFLLGPLSRREPFHTYFYLFAWVPFLWASFRWLRRRRPNHPWSLVRGPARMLPWSVTLWLVFEVVNFRLSNWSYHGVPGNLWVRWPGYAAAFATVLPGVLLLAAIFDGRVGEERADGARRGGARWPLVVGAALLILPLAWPRYFFPLVWGALFFLVEPSVEAGGGHSLMRDWRQGRWRPTLALLGAGFLAGGYWEACNFWAGAKWTYDVPFVGGLKLFEMPALGFLGFPPFALELYAAHEFLRLRGRRAVSPTALVLQVLFWFLAFAGIDRFTVVPR